MIECPLRATVRRLLGAGAIDRRTAAGLLRDHRVCGCRVCAERRADGGADDGRAAGAVIVAFPGGAARAGDVRTPVEPPPPMDPEAEHRALARVPAARRPATALRGRRRYRSLELVERCLASARGELADDPHEALAWADAAETILQHLHFEPAARERAFAAGVRALAYRAGAHRRLGETSRAAAESARAAELARREGLDDPELLAEIEQP